ncbi:MAG: hypothetical protein GY847_17890, partial [Proteobacteria bacterium]|nr:hypothetical protein [Pseudomonadota bacterium]
NSSKYFILVFLLLVSGCSTASRGPKDTTGSAELSTAVESKETEQHQKLDSTNLKSCDSSQESQCLVSGHHLTNLDEKNVVRLIWSEDKDKWVRFDSKKIFPEANLTIEFMNNLERPITFYSFHRLPEYTCIDTVKSSGRCPYQKWLSFGPGQKQMLLPGHSVRYDNELESSLMPFVPASEALKSERCYDIWVYISRDALDEKVTLCYRRPERRVAETK